MDIFEIRHDHATVLHIEGRVNSVNAPQLTERLKAHLEQGCRTLVVDFSHLDHMTSAGFRSLLFAEKLAHGVGARMVLCGLNGLTLELFEIGGFLEMFVVAASREEALRRAAAVSLDG